MPRLAFLVALLLPLAARANANACPDWVANHGDISLEWVTCQGNEVLDGGSLEFPLADAGHTSLGAVGLRLPDGTLLTTAGGWSGLALGDGGYGVFCPFVLFDSMGNPWFTVDCQGDAYFVGGLTLQEEGDLTDTGPNPVFSGEPLQITLGAQGKLTENSSTGDELDLKMAGNETLVLSAPGIHEAVLGVADYPTGSDGGCAMGLEPGNGSLPACFRGDGQVQGHDPELPHDMVNLEYLLEGDLHYGLPVTYSSVDGGQVYNDWAGDAQLTGWISVEGSVRLAGEQDGGGALIQYVDGGPAPLSAQTFTGTQDASGEKQAVLLEQLSPALGPPDAGTTLAEDFAWALEWSPSDGDKVFGGAVAPKTGHFWGAAIGECPDASLPDGGALTSYVDGGWMVVEEIDLTSLTVLCVVTVPCEPKEFLTTTTCQLDAGVSFPAGDVIEPIASFGTASCYSPGCIKGQFQGTYP